MARLRRLPSALWYPAALLVAIALAVAAQQSTYFPGDVELAQTIQAARSPWLDGVMALASLPGAWPLAVAWAGVVAALLFLFRLRLEAIFVFLSVIGFGLSELIKALVRRPRPSPELVAVLEGTSGHSFPSGHVLFSLVFLGFLFYLATTLLSSRALRRALQVALGAAIVLGAISRVYLGAHWPSDVLGSLLFGGALLVAFIGAYRGFLPRRRYY